MTYEEAAGILISQAIVLGRARGKSTLERIRIEAICKAVEALEKQATQEWISVDDRLPEPWKQVLIYSRYDFCESAFYIGVPGKWRVTWNHEMLDADSVTHWMPLPEPPKGE